jgi:DNA-binding LacI/PurR family transcriptional regulator
VLIAVAVGWDGRRSVLGVELANRESRSSWRDFLLGLRERGLHGSSSWSPATMPGSARRGARWWRKPPTSAARCTFCATRSIACRALRALRRASLPGIGSMVS